MQTVGVILAGGNSTRFGTDKSLYDVGGKKMYQHVHDAIQGTGVCDSIVVNTNARLKDEFSLPTIVDEPSYRDHGPLGGLYAAASRYPGAQLLVVSCDTPHITTEWLTLLIDKADTHADAIIVSAEGGTLHPLIGVFQGESLRNSLQDQLDSKRLSLRAFFESQNVIQADAIEEGISTNIFRNINYKNDID